MTENVWKMIKNCFFFLAINRFTFALCEINLYIVGKNENNAAFPVPNTLKVVKGSNLSLTCGIGNHMRDSELVWGKRNKFLKFKNESDLVTLAEERNPFLYKIHDRNLPYEKSKAVLRFNSVQDEDYGAYFCMYLKYKLFKVVNIRVVNVGQSSLICTKNMFRCVENGRCINLHYKCDGRKDCLDGSDEYYMVCGGDPCLGKIHCPDGRCIPNSWCCNKLTDINCNVENRPTCCPALIDPYDPVHWYYNQTVSKEVNKSNGSRYLFISIYVMSAILSFVLFLFIISKVCGFDKSPNQRNAYSNSLRNETTCFTNPNVCDHSQCAVRREINSTFDCLYRTDASISVISNNQEQSDPLIANGMHSEFLDQPPSYDEAVADTSSFDKNPMEYLITVPPPPYNSTNVATEGRSFGNLNASNNNS